MAPNLNPDQYDEIAQYAAGGVAVVAVAALAYTETIPAPEALTIILGVLSALGAYESGRRGERKKNDAPGRQELADVFANAASEIVGDMLAVHDQEAERSVNRKRLHAETHRAGESDQRSQTGTPAAHPAADTPKTPAADPAESEPVTAIQGIGSGRSSDLSGAGIETVADLASANVQQLASETGLSARRIKKWQALARER